MKVSQAFKSEKGADAFAILHSIMDTAEKNNQSPFLALKNYCRYRYLNSFLQSHKS